MSYLLQNTQLQECCRFFLTQSLIAKGRPIEVEKSSTFVVDLTCLKDPDDVKKDTYGRWNYSGSHPDSFDDVSIEKCALGATCPNVYYLRRIRSSHPSNPNFRQLIAFVHGKCATLKKHRIGSVISCAVLYFGVVEKSRDFRTYFPTMHAC